MEHIDGILIGILFYGKSILIPCYWYMGYWWNIDLSVENNDIYVYIYIYIYGIPSGKGLQFPIEIVDLPMKIVIFHSFVNVYQRVDLGVS